jgi:tetratricopeptide (TPR) repeat protein
MLFDLSSPGRKTAVRIIFGFLALIFVVGFVGFGIGGETGGGGIIDSISGGGSSTDDQFEQQIEDAESKLEEDPSDERALQDLAYYRAQSGNAQVETDEAGQPTLTEDARDEFEAAADAWSRYLETEPRKPDLATGRQMIGVYQALGDTEAAADTQEVLVKIDPDFVGYRDLAYYRYLDLDLKGGDAALDKARAEATKEEEQQLKQFTGLRERVVKAKKQLAKQPDSEAGAESALQNPLGGLDPSGSVPPTAP